MQNRTEHSVKIPLLMRIIPGELLASPDSRAALAQIGTVLRSALDKLTPGEAATSPIVVLWERDLATYVDEALTGRMIRNLSRELFTVGDKLRALALARQDPRSLEPYIRVTEQIERELRPLLGLAAAAADGPRLVRP